jgi:hypothetical protein
MEIADPEIKTILNLYHELDQSDPDDLAIQTRVMEKMKRDNKKMFDETINQKVWNIHNEKGELVPHIFKDGKFQKIPNQDDIQWGDLFCIHCKKELTEQEIDDEGEGCPLLEGGCGIHLCEDCCKRHALYNKYFYKEEIWFDLCKKCMSKK